MYMYICVCVCVCVCVIQYNYIVGREDFQMETFAEDSPNLYAISLG